MDHSMPKPNDHKHKCRCKECWCHKHRFSLRRPTEPPHGWMYEECPLCLKQEPPAIDDVAAPC